MQLEPRSPSARQSRLANSTARYRDAALGLVSTCSFPAIVGTADAMMKSADVILVGYEKIGSGHCTAVVRGGVANVRMAVEAGVQTAQQFGQLMSSLVIPRPSPNLEVVLPIRVRWEEFLYEKGNSRMSNQALGLLETRGFPAMVGAADAMLKSADVQLIAHETIGGGLCTALIRGSLSNVVLAVEAGMHEAERIGDLHAVMVIPRPLDELEQSLPAVSVDLRKEEPLSIPLSLREEVREPLALEQKRQDAQELSLPDPSELPISEEQEL
jgi:carbon dioxide concentrating mechanism protein CcmO